MILAESTATLWSLCAIMSLETSYFLQSNRFDNWETSSHLLNTFFSKSVLQKYCHVSTRFRRRNSVVQVKWFYLQWRWVVLLIKSSSYSQFKSLLFTRSNKGGDFVVIAIMVRQHSDWRLGQTNKHTDQEGDRGMGCFMENKSYILN